jgi:hypothetical protein
MAGRQQWILGGLLAATVAAAFYEPGTSGEAEPVEVVPPRRAVPSVVGDGDGASLSRPPYQLAVADLFPPRGWQAPAPPPVAAVPKAPPLPFRYLGRLDEGGRRVVFLGQGPRTHLVSEGQVVAEYRAEHIGRDGMTLMYLPLNEKQHLSFGSVN